MAHAGNLQTQEAVRATNLPAWLRKADFTSVRRHTTLIEREAPLSPISHQVERDALAFWAARAQPLDLPEGDQAYWATLRDPSERERLLEHPDYYVCEGNILAIGEVPRKEA